MNLERRIEAMREQGHSWEAIARTFRAEGIPTLSGKGTWWAATVRSVLHRPDRAAYMRAYRRRGAD